MFKKIYTRSPSVSPVASPSLLRVKYQNYLPHEKSIKLFKAMKANKSEKIALLIETGADINSSDMFDNTLLHLVCVEDKFGIAKFLVKAGANVNQLNFFKETPLHMAARYNCREISELLIRHHAEVNLIDRDGHSPLHRAVLNNNKYITEMLLKANADFSIPFNYLYSYILNDNNKTVLIIAAENGNTDIMSMLFKHGADLNTKSSHENTALHLAAYNGQLNAVKFLIDHHAEVHHKNAENHTAFEIAQFKGFKRIAQMIKNKMDLNFVFEGEKAQESKGEEKSTCSLRMKLFGHKEA